MQTRERDFFSQQDNIGGDLWACECGRSILQHSVKMENMSPTLYSCLSKNAPSDQIMTVRIFAIGFRIFRGS